MAVTSVHETKPSELGNAFFVRVNVIETLQNEYVGEVTDGTTKKLVFGSRSVFEVELNVGIVM